MALVTSTVGCGDAPGREPGDTDGTSTTVAATDSDGGGPTSGGAQGTDGTAGADGTTGVDSTGDPDSTGSESGEEPPVDPCVDRTPVCPDEIPTQGGQGLVQLDRCAFGLDRGASFDELEPLAIALESVATPVPLSTVLDDLNRDAVVVAPGAVPGGPAGVVQAFRWDAAENAKPTWYPQGISGSADANETGLVEGRRWVVASFYFNEDGAPGASPKGVRIAFVDVTDASPRYRFVLLVEPTAGPDFGPVLIHAGGIVWLDDHLYVADTFGGVRVFDMNHLLQVDTSQDVIGCGDGVCRGGLYKYVLPQIGRFDRYSACDPAPRFSFLGLDRSGPTPLLISGEYCSGTACDGPYAGRVIRYALALNDAVGARTFSADAFFMGERQVQGATSLGDLFLLSSSAPPGGAGELYSVTLDGSDSQAWVDTPEDLFVDHPNQLIWSLSEEVDERYVFASELGVIAGP